jgi:hypothetical protein
MNDLSFDVFTRRASLATLSAAGLAALVGPFAADAKSANKKAKKKCKSQVAQCTAFITADCSDNPNPECLAVLPCCDSLGTCDVNTFFACLVG